MKSSMSVDYYYVELEKMQNAIFDAEPVTQRS